MTSFTVDLPHPSQYPRLTYFRLTSNSDQPGVWGGDDLTPDENGYLGHVGIREIPIWKTAHGRFTAEDGTSIRFAAVIDRDGLWRCLYSVPAPGATDVEWQLVDALLDFVLLAADHRQPLLDNRPYLSTMLE